MRKILTGKLQHIWSISTLSMVFTQMFYIKSPSQTHTHNPFFQCMNSSFSPSLYLCLVITWNPKTKRQTNAHKNAKYHKIYFVLMNYHRKSRQKSRFINSQSTKAHLCPKTHKQTRAYTVWFKANPYLKIKRTFHS